MDLAALAEQIEYKVAPPPLIAVQGLANTFAFEPEEERLIDPGSARRWMLESDLAEPGIEVSAAEHRSLVDARATIRDLIDANLTGDVAGPAAGLRRLAEEHRVSLAAGSEGELGLDLAPVASVDALIAQLLGIIFQAQVEGTWRRLKVCASDECRWSFFDSSRNHGGTWCQMDTCGNKIKNRTYRRRVAARR